MKVPVYRRVRFQEGIALVEWMVAVLIFSIGILGIVGLQGAMIKATSDARYRSVASYAAQQRIGQLWTTTNTGALIEPAPGTDISAQIGLPNGRRTTISGDPSCFADPRCFIVRVSWQMPGSDDVHSVVSITYLN